MTPKAYANLYTDMTWTYNKVAHKVNIYQYTLNSAGYKRLGKVKAGAEAFRAALRAAAAAKTVAVAGGGYSAKSADGQAVTLETGSIDRTFTGKGAPEDIRRVLWMATHLGLVGNPPSAHTLAPQAYADLYLGTDCSGFALNYLGVGREAGTTIERLDRSKAALRRKSANEVLPGDVMISCNKPSDYHHIALVVSKQMMSGGVMKVFTVESYGWTMDSPRYPKGATVGISDHDHLVIIEKPGVFHKQKWNSKERKQYFSTTEDIYFQPPGQRGPLGV